MVRAHLGDSDNFVMSANKNARTVKDAKESLEKSLLVRALTDANFNISKAAKALGISRNTLYSRMEKYAIQSSKPTRS